MLNSGISYALLLNFFLIPPALEAGEVLEAVVASVNGKPILLSDLHRARLEREQIFQEKVTDLTLVREQLIEDLLLATYAEEKRIALSQEEVEAEIEAQAQKRKLSKKEYLSLLEEQGIPPETFRRFFRQQLLRTRIIQKEILPWVTVDDADLVSHRRTHPDRFRTPPQVELYYTVVEEERLGELLPSCIPLSTCSKKNLPPELGKELLPETRKGVFSLDDLPEELRVWITQPLLPLTARLFEEKNSRDKKGRIRIVIFSRRIPSRDLPLEEIREQLTEEVRRYKLEQAYTRWLNDLKRNAIIERFPIPGSL